MTDGLPITESEIYNPEEPYENRDPRFKQSILYIGAPWRNRTATTADLHQTGYSLENLQSIMNKHKEQFQTLM